MNSLISQLQNGDELSRQQVNVAAEFLLDASGSVEVKKALLVALSSKGETPSEITYFVEAFLNHAKDPETDGIEFEGPTIDVCGTGGDKLNLFNVSTTSMFVIAAGGAVVVKHGNRGITSKSGGADVLEALGIRLDLPLEQLHRCLKEAGVAFLFAPMYHPAFKEVAPVRAELAKEGARSIFNLIGPLLNPVRPQCQLIGVCDPQLGPVFAQILQSLGREAAWIVHGRTDDGRSVDEMSLMGETEISKSGSMLDTDNEVVHPEEFALRRCDVEELVGGEAEENAEILVGILDGTIRDAKRDMVLLNAGAGLACAGLADDLGAGVKLAGELIDSGEALKRLRLMQEIAK
ncbi:anthranilate phosphoribosyltransferase [Rubritalea marina]|uniref:anthranilate phosphoribosyltransferase n=1 Tax=Rubritalea marina TaxID=361055 RepID=UPI000526E072|nr:anthranilate phosphoribosyltransferase [Rubritalea marina]